LVIAPPTSVPIMVPPVCDIASRAMALVTRSEPTRSNTSARRLVMSSTPPTPTASMKGYTIQTRTAPPITSAAMSRATGTRAASCAMIVRRRSKRSEMTPPRMPPKNMGAKKAAPTSCTSSGEPLRRLTK
jgi:hypothetical protein